MPIIQFHTIIICTEAKCKIINTNLKAHVQAFSKEIISATYGEKMVMGCFQIVEIDVQHLSQSYINDPLGPVWFYRNLFGRGLKGSCLSSFGGHSKAYLWRKDGDEISSNKGDEWCTIQPSITLCPISPISHISITICILKLVWKSLV